MGRVIALRKRIHPDGLAFSRSMNEPVIAGIHSDV
jgi:hypothetical protein